MKRLLILLFCCCTSTVYAQFSLGDIGFSAYCADPSQGGNPDDFTIVLLRNVRIGEQIAFTDKGWKSGGGFSSGEGSFVLTFSKNYVAGTQLVVSRLPHQVIDIFRSSAGTITGSALDFDVFGDQVFLYDPSNPPTTGNETGFVAAIHMNGAWDADAMSENTSSKPAVFTDGMNSISLNPEVDNARINLPNCFAFNDIASLRVLVNTSTNWGETSNLLGYRPLPPVCDFVKKLSYDSLINIRPAIQIFPNPCFGPLEIYIPEHLGQSQMKISDLKGRLVYAINLESGNNELDLEEVSKGIFIIRITGEDSEYYQKLVRQ